MVIRRLPEVEKSSETLNAENTRPEERLAQKGLPAVAVSKIKIFFKFWISKLWHFILEAKDLKPTRLAGFKIKQLLEHVFPSGETEAALEMLEKPIIKQNETQLLEAIQREPKNLNLYDNLGKHYLVQKKYQDAKDVYEYLVSHDPANPVYCAKLASTFYNQKNYEKASEWYRKSVALDSTHPSRYYNLGLALKAQKKYAQSAEALKKALELEPDNLKYKDVYAHVAQLVEQLHGKE